MPVPGAPVQEIIVQRVEQYLERLGTRIERPPARQDFYSKGVHQSFDQHVRGFLMPCHLHADAIVENRQKPSHRYGA